VPPPIRRLRAVVLVCSALVLAVAAAGYLIIGGGRHNSTAAPPPGCQAGTGVAAIPLAVNQAGIAATIAGVAARHGLGRPAVVVAYAAALQESQLQNLDYGDRDSVGVFQQRPSQGWGTTAEIEDPVYATTRFFAALVKVHGYAKMPVAQAAQAVQHSADGYAYGQWAEVATLLADYFTGSDPAGVSCWYSPGPKTNVTAALKQLTSTFGPGGQDRVLVAMSTDRPAGNKKDRTVQAIVRVQRDAAWTVASWLVAYAQQYGISQVRYAGYAWTAADGSAGWQRAASQPLAAGSIVAG
jgi:hypothetical protein